MYLLQKEVELQEIVQLVGPDALPESEKVVLEVTRMIREDFLQQSAYSDTDSFCPLDKQFWMLKVILSFYDAVIAAMKRGVLLRSLMSMPVRNEIARMKEQDDLQKIQGIHLTITQQAEALEVKACSAR